MNQDYIAERIVNGDSLKRELESIRKDIIDDNFTELRYSEFEELYNLIAIHKPKIDFAYSKTKAPNVDTFELIKDISNVFPKLEWEVITSYTTCLVIRTLRDSPLDISFDYSYEFKVWYVSAEYNYIDLFPNNDDEPYSGRFRGDSILKCAKLLKSSIENLLKLKELL